MLNVPAFSRRPLCFFTYIFFETMKKNVPALTKKNDVGMTDSAAKKMSNVSGRNPAGFFYCMQTVCSMEFIKRLYAFV